MKELIDKLARGVIEYDLPVLEVSVSEIEIKVHSEKAYRNNFTVFSSNGVPLKGFVYSTSEFIIIEDKVFEGEKAIINYSVATDYISDGDEVNGEIYVVSNGGEVNIPVTIKVESISCTTSIGELKNLFHFANFVQMNYDEALTIFKSKNFAHIFLQDDFYLLSMYEGLIKSTSIEVAMEEFLVSANKKQPTKIAISQNNKEYDIITEDEGDTIIISKENWGYTNIDIVVKDEFIEVSKNKITSEDFAGSNYEFAFCIKKDKLHAGNNYGVIEFVTKTQTERLTISAKRPATLSEINVSYDTSIKEIYRKYIDFRVHRIDMDKWADGTLDVIERMRSVSDKSVFLKLLQAQVCISKGMEKDSSWLLESAAEELFESGNKDEELYCYYLYVRTIQKRNPEFTAEMIEKIKSIYNTKSDSWKILWILFYLDESFDNNLSIKLARIKEKYVQGMKSPLMYYEAAAIFIQSPEFLRVLDGFELQVLNFASREGIITKQLAMQIAELAMNTKVFNKLLFSILAELYDMYGTKHILMAIVGMLIKGNKTDSKYFFWYEEAVIEEIKLTSLYEYFMYSLPEDYNKPLPQLVVLYFGYNSGISNDKLAVVYENLLIYKDDMEQVYKANYGQVERFASKSLEAGLIDEHFATIYKEVLKKAMIIPEIANVFPKLANTYFIKVEQDNIKEIEVVHKETKEVSVYPVVNKKAYVQIYTEDAAVIFVDVNGVRYGKSVNCTKVKLLDMEEYLELCLEINPDDKNLILYMADRYLKYREQPDKAIYVLRQMVKLPDVRDEYRIYVEREIISYYSTNYDFDVVDEYLMTVDGMNLLTKSRVKLIELMIVRGLYERAYEMMARFGYSNIDAARVLRCGTKLIESREYALDELLVNMVMYAYRKGKYNEKVLKYLSTYFQGATKELNDLWDSCVAYDYHNRNLDESLIASILFTGVCSNCIGKVYESYYLKGPNEKIRRAYLFAKAYDYFVKEKVVDQAVFKYIEKDIILDNPLHDICKLAYVKYKSTDDELTERQVEICRDIIFHMCSIGRYFNCYKKYEKYFSLPLMMQDKTIVEYHTNPNNHVTIHYHMGEDDTPGNQYMTKEMKDVCNGIFVMEFVVFYGEEIHYYITEESDGEQTITESAGLTLDDEDAVKDVSRESRYTYLNDIMVAYEMKDNDTLEELATEYVIKTELLDMIFKIK